ncbi:hypothetical protein [Streptomyces sp. NPDC056105]|uniref:hypothetical protein n=1 Tax=Streptomyces sp. NPDC056105 TaxID=3345714 RepID=UPI0035E1D1E4
MVDSARIADIAQQHPNRLRALEQRTIAAAAQPLAQALTNAQAAAVTRWVRDTAQQAAPVGDALQKLIAYVRGLLRDAFASTGKQAQHLTEQAAFNAAQISARQASGIAAAMRGQTPPPLDVDAGDDAQRTCEAIPAAVDEEHRAALALLTAAGLTAMGLAGLNSIFKRARRAIGRIAQHAATALTQAAANASRLAALVLGPSVRLLWVAEPDACAACAAYAGLHIPPGGRFTGGLSLDPRRTVFTSAIPGPPRHPHCRCVLIPWSSSWRLDGPPLPTLLRQRARTARRS